MRTQPEIIIQRLEADNSRLAKEAIINSAMNEGLDEFFEGLRMCYDALCTFGVKQVPTKADTGGQGLPWSAFKELAQKLRSRELTGHDARDAIELAMSVATQSQWNDFYRRILIKDMRAGFSETTINKVVAKKRPDYLVPVFSCQLAHDSANHETKVTGNKLIEVKLDGCRILTIVHPDGKVEQFSRNGKELANFEHIKEQFSTIAHELSEPYVFDGEVMSSSFQDLMKQIHRKESSDTKDTNLFLFDVVPLASFVAGKHLDSQQNRSAKLSAFYTAYSAKLANVRIVEQELVNLSTPAGNARYTEINKLAIAGGYEGIMLKDPSAPYECKRSVSWLKLKPFIEVSLHVVAVEEGTGKNVGKLGAIVCEGVDDGKFIRVNVGSGFTDTDRDQLWATRDSLIDMVAEVRADAATKNQDSDNVYSLRFPRFKGFRGTTKGEKI